MLDSYHSTLPRLLYHEKMQRFRGDAARVSFEP